MKMLVLHAPEKLGLKQDYIPGPRGDGTLRLESPPHGFPALRNVGSAVA